MYSDACYSIQMYKCEICMRKLTPTNEKDEYSCKFQRVNAAERINDSAAANWLHLFNRISSSFLSGKSYYRVNLINVVFSIIWLAIGIKLAVLVTSMPFKL